MEEVKRQPLLRRLIPPGIIGLFWATVTVLDWWDRTSSAVNKARASKPVLGTLMAYLFSPWGKLALFCTALVYACVVIRRASTAASGSFPVSIEVEQGLQLLDVAEWREVITLPSILLTNRRDHPVSVDATFVVASGGRLRFHAVNESVEEWEALKKKYVVSPNPLITFPVTLAARQARRGYAAFLSDPGGLSLIEILGVGWSPGISAVSIGLKERWTLILELRDLDSGATIDCRVDPRDMLIKDLSSGRESKVFA